MARSAGQDRQTTFIQIFIYFFQLNVGKAKIYRKDQHDPRGTIREDEQMDIEEGEIPVSE